MTETGLEQNNAKIFKGTILAVDTAEKTVTVKGVFFRKTFQTSDACKVSLEDKPVATLDDLRTGHKVTVHYQKTQGVPIAGQFQQHNVVFRGHITAINLEKRALAIKGSAGTRSFVLADDCSVMLKEEQVGTLENLKIGHTVSVAYEAVNDGWTARKIEQKADTFVGNIQAIDASTRTVKARKLTAEKKFILGDGCRIIVENKADASLRDLRIGDRAAFTYEEVNGVLVANRIGLDSTTKTDTAHVAGTGSSPP